MGRTKIGECHLPKKKGGRISSVAGGFLVSYAFVFRNVIKGYSRAKDEPGSNEKTMGEGGDAVLGPFTFRFRSQGSPRIHVLLPYFFSPFNYYRKSCPKPSLQLHLLFFLSGFIFIIFTSSISEKTFSN